MNFLEYNKKTSFTLVEIMRSLVGIVAHRHTVMGDRLSICQYLALDMLQPSYQ